MRLFSLAALLCAAAGPALAQPAPAPFMPATVSGEQNDYNLSLSDDGRTMVFARSDADFRGARIMVSMRKGKGWTPPRPIEFSDDRWRDSDPWLTEDGRTLYFVSDRPTAAKPAKPDLDIWRSVLKNGRWQVPEHLGDTVNGGGDELGPELHGGTLYFATARRSGMGGLDIYAARGADGGFGKPALLPAPINSAASESDFTLSRDGRTALFWRSVGDKGLLHVSRMDADGGWSEPAPLSAAANIGPFNFTPSLSADGSRLSFASTLPRAGQPEGMADIYQLPLATVLPATDPR